jgi:hypothetical protein
MTSNGPISRPKWWCAARRSHGRFRRIVPTLVAAVDLAEATDTRLAELGTARLAKLTNDVVADWRQRPPRRRLVRPVIPTASAMHARGRRRLTDDLV